MPTKKPRCPNGSRRKPKKTGKCIKTKKKSSASANSFLKGIKSKSSASGNSFLKGIKSKSSASGNSFLKGIKSKSSKTLTLPSSSKTKKKGNYRSFLKCEMKKLKKENPDMRQQSIMKMAAKNWNKGK
jgi:hypothetical protein